MLASSRHNKRLWAFIELKHAGLNQVNFFSLFFLGEEEGDSTLRRWEERDE